MAKQETIKTKAWRALKIFAVGTIAVLSLYAVFYQIIDQPQCEGAVTDHCIVGANLGLGFLWVLAVILEFFVVITATCALIFGKNRLPFYILGSIGYLFFVCIVSLFQVYVALVLLFLLIILVVYAIIKVWRAKSVGKTKKPVK